MNGVLERSLALLELLADHGEGLELGAMAERLNIPRSAVHRLLADLTRLGYVRQARGHGAYMLTTRLVALGLSYLARSGVVDVAQPLLDQLADASGELVRLSVVDGDRLTWVARAQGARQGLRYDPDMGSDARLSCSASGWAWLSTLKDDAALALLARQGLGDPASFGPQAPKSMTAVMKAVRATRRRGYSLTVDTYTLGLGVIAAPVRLPGQEALGVLSVAGPTARFTSERMDALAPELLATAHRLAQASGASAFFRQTGAGAARHGSDTRRPIYAD